MRAPTWIRACAALALGLSGAACSTPPPKAAGEPASQGPTDEWKRSATWLYATRDAKGGPAGECDFVRKLLAEETRCRGPLCRFGVELAGEWRNKCDKLAPGAVEEVSTLRAELDDRMQREPTTCSRDFERLLKDACQSEQCAERAQRWVTRCGESDAGPLCIAMLERAVERALGPDEAPRLDTRSCATIAKAVRAAGRCTEENACRDALPEVEGYLARCSTEDSKPDLPTALALQGIALGAEREPKAIAIADEPKQVAPGDMPLALGDGSGAILEICHRRVVDRAEYFAAREKCQGTRMSVARIFSAKGGGRELRLGQLLVPEPLPVTSLYPAFEVAGELEELGKQKLAQIQAELSAVTEAAEGAAAGQLLAFVDRNADWLERSEAIRRATRSADGKLVSVLRKLGEAKANAMRQSRDTLAQRGLLERARTRALADVRADGTVQLGASTRAFWLDTAKLWPEASTAHYTALATLERTLKNSPKPAAATVETQLTRARAQAKACGAAVRERLDSEQALLACVFDGCDDARRAELGERWQRARAAADGARQELDLSLAPLGQSALDAGMAVEAGCAKAKR